MTDDLCHRLMTTLRPHFALSKSRLTTLAFLIVGLAHGRTVNLSHIASIMPGPALISSHYRRLQRFFQYVRLDQAVVAMIIVRLLNLSRPTCLALDRTNWKVGSKDINILMLAIVTRRFRVPLLWTMLDHRGNSDTSQRIALMQRYLDLFGAHSIEILLADREFIGARWMDFLNANAIAFAIRIKTEQHLTMPDGQKVQVQSWLRHKRGRTTTRSLTGRLSQAQTILTVIAKQLKSGEWLVVATNLKDNPKRALNLYRRRWAIECLFADAKTRGFNMEDTRITHQDKISTLLAILALATAWAYRCATTVMGMKTIKRKTHKRRDKSWFRTGLDALRNWIINKPDKAITAWTKTCPKVKIRG